MESTLQTHSRGLTEDEVWQRKQKYGDNILKEIEPPNVLLVFLHQFTSPLIYILIIAALLTLYLGEYIDSAVIAAVILLNAIIGFIQEYKAERSVRSLMQLVSPHATVRRNGQEIDIESRDLVPGDLVLLESGMRVPADIRLYATTALQIDESLLTGESVPVAKSSQPNELNTPLAERTCMAFTGSIVTTGRGRGYVVSIGKNTELGAIAESMREGEAPQTPMQKRMLRFAKIVAITVLFGSIATFIIGYAKGESIVDMFKLAVALAVAAVPEGLPVVFTITLALGVNRMAKRNAIVRRLPAVETLGSTNVIGSDKTGTLTENKMTAQELWVADEIITFEKQLEVKNEDTPVHLALLTGAMTNEAHLEITDKGHEAHGDPTEVALLMSAAMMGIDFKQARETHKRIAEIPFEPDLQYSASIRQKKHEHWMFVKGAPEKILDMSKTILHHEGEKDISKQHVLDQAQSMASRGMRVLGLAYRVLPENIEPDESPPTPEHLTFLGLIGMKDPPREGVQEAIDGCKKAGMRVLMITGDHAMTALAIGKELGITNNNENVLTGQDIEKMTEQELIEKVSDVSIYARVTPEHKYRIVKSLQAKGQVVAVTGDGVNDAPALKAADIGVAMGKSGTDVAREAADIVLADDNFVSIYAAVEEGRVTFDNVRNATFFLISTGAASIIAILTSFLLGWPLPMLPAQLLWMNLVTNGLQDVALAFELGDKDVLKRPPRDANEGIISRILWERTVIVGILMAVGMLSLFKWELDQTGSLARAQTVALTAMVLFQNFHVGNSRSERKSIFTLSPFSNPFLLIAALSALLIHASALYLPWTQFVLRVEPIEFKAWTRIVFVALSVIVLVETHKFIRSKIR